MAAAASTVKMEGIFNRVPSISEDTLQYTLYPPSNISDKVSVTTLATCIHSYVDALLPGFLWHRDSFELKVAANSNGHEFLLKGRMRVGDSIDDEWCVVWLLREISKNWDIAISVFDSDGEFLLIEAADFLPAWVKPTNSENRVWIYSSHLHLIPINHISPPFKRSRRRESVKGEDSDSDEEGGDMSEIDADEFLDVENALGLIRDPTVGTKAPAEVENAVWQRISGYPEATRNHTHTTKAYLPLDIARVLSVNPSLVQKPIEMFYTRDAIQLRVAHHMARFPPEPSVLRAVKMTRTAYALLVGQNFHPPKVFGKWRERESTDAWRWRDVGMKIAVGFEMLYQESKGRNDPSSNTAEGARSSTEARKDALRRNPDYITYIQNLVSLNYFKGELERSQLWNTLEDKAAATFIEARQESESSRSPFASQVNAAIIQNNAVGDSSEELEDSDSWLNVDAQDFDDRLEKNLGKSKHGLDAMDVDGTDETEEERLANSQASRLKNMAQKVEHFVEGDGYLEGAKFDDERSDDNGDLSDFSEDMSEDSDDDDDDEDDGARQAAMDKLVPALEASDYGKMPASFHSNSQKVAPATLETENDATATNGPSIKPVREPILPRDRYDGVDSDDGTDEDETPYDDESEEDQPQVVGDIEVDMGEEEEEFLEFAREALGISEAQWNEIVQDRKDRGVFVPTSVKTENKNKGPTPKVESTDREPKLRAPVPGPRPNANPNLDSFEAVMQAMDAELGRLNPTQSKGKGKSKAAEEEDTEAAMDAELKALLESNNVDGGDEGEDGDEQTSGMDYNLIKNFLESFKSQAGLSGPVSNLVGRLDPGWQLPRDNS